MNNFVTRSIHLADNLFDVDEVHRRYRASPTGRVTLFILASLILYAELFAVSILLEDFWQEALLIHFACVAAAVIYTVISIRLRKGARFGTIFSIFLIVLGPFAAAGIMLTLIMFKISKARALSFTEWYYSIFPEQSHSPAEELAAALQYGRDKSWLNYDVIPFIDVIKRGTEAQKREAILRMTQYFHPEFGAVLKLALREDASNVVRVQAATAITKIKNSFFSQLLKLEKLRQRHPDKHEVLLAIASVYDDLAFSTILEPEQEVEVRNMSLRFYQEYMTHKPQDARIHYLIGRLMLRQGRYEEAVRWLENAITPETAKLDIWVLYAECLFRLGRFNDLRRQAAANHDLVVNSRRYPDSICESVAFWSGRPLPKPANVSPDTIESEAMVA